MVHSLVKIRVPPPKRWDGEEIGLSGKNIILGEMKQYRKKPVVVTAYVATEPMVIRTLEGDMQAQKGDYIITGVSSTLASRISFTRRMKKWYNRKVLSDARKRAAVASV